MIRKVITLLLRVLQHPVAVFGIAVLYPGTSAENLGPLPDSRPAKLEAFFKSYQCPRPYYIEDYLRAADTYGVDYRLLPALSVRESTCGQYDRRNNRWGWDSARTGFRSVPVGIEFVTGQLAQGDYYEGKSLEEKIYTYNPLPRYVAEVKHLMREIDE
jgi:hypothetical protein